MGLSVAVFLVQHEVLHTQNTELVQSRFSFLGILALCALVLGFGHNLLEISGDYQTSAFLVNLRNSIAEWSCSKAAHASVRLCRRETLKLLQLRTRGKHVAWIQT